MNARPLATSIMARVMMKAGIANKVTMIPEKKPTSPHTQTPAVEHKIIDPLDAFSAPPTSRIRQVAITADNAIRLPTDRSMPPVMMTRVIPIAMIAITAI
jgi:hypothetical protein